MLWPTSRYIRSLVRMSRELINSNRMKEETCLSRRTIKHWTKRTQSGFREKLQNLCPSGVFRTPMGKALSNLV